MANATITPPATVSRTAKLLRDLQADEFHEVYGCDRFTASVMTNRFGYIIEHMCSHIQTTAFSPIIRDFTDIAAAITGPPSLGWAMAAVSQAIPIFNGTIPDAIRIALEEYGLDNLRTGDVLFSNDYYRVGNHLNDVCFIRPVFREGKLLGAAALRAHMLDWGGRVFGGFEATKTTTYEDGLVIPPTLLFSTGKPVKSVFSLIQANTRLGHLVLPDIQTIYSSLELADRMINETIDKYGVEAYLGGIRYVCDTSAETMRLALERLPDGIYQAQEIIDSDAIDNSEEYVVNVRINKRGGRAEFDLSGSSHAARSAINCSWADTKTAVALALKLLIDPTSPFTSGSLRDVDILPPPGSIVNPMPPHCCMYYWEPLLAIICATFRALNEPLGENAIAAESWGGTTHNVTGVGPDGKLWISSSEAVPNGPWGATSHGDGDSAQLMYFLNWIWAGNEQVEATSPLVVLRREYVPDSAGPGRNRGGAATLIDSLWLQDSEQYVSNFHLKRPPAGGGVHGGGAGSLGGGWFWDSANSKIDTRDFLPLTLSSTIYGEATPVQGLIDPETHELDPRGKYYWLEHFTKVSANSVTRFISNGAGGWGNPFERDPERVLRDVRDEYVTIEGAARDYGVVVNGDPSRDPEGLRVDYPATERLRVTLLEHGSRNGG